MDKRDMAINIYEELKYHVYSRLQNMRIHCGQKKTRHLRFPADVGAHFVDLFKYTITNEYVSLIW